MGATAEEAHRWSWTPRVPLTAAERRVDFVAHNDHIVLRRLAVERHALPSARRLALAVAEFGLPTAAIERELEGALYVSLARSVDFGFQQVKRELRGDRPTIRAAVRLPGIGERGRVVLSGLAGIHGLVRSRANIVAGDVANAATQAAHQAATEAGANQLKTTIAVRLAVAKTLHNDVLQLVGEALNLGRAAGAMESRPVPEFAMRSEQLDKNTCEPCDHLHGEIVRVDSSEYYDLMPPSGCAGGGRCRGIMVFGE
jgi:hypothetical protein